MVDVDGGSGRDIVDDAWVGGGDRRRDEPGLEVVWCLNKEDNELLALN